jgi:predicted RNase H-like nuclease
MPSSLPSSLSPVAGIDGCRGGWVAVVWNGAASLVESAASLSELVLAIEPQARDLVGVHAGAMQDGPVIPVIGIDMPMGLPDRGARQADRLAQKVLGRRASSIFVTPTRDACWRETHQQVSDRNKELEGPGISIQAFNLLPKVREVDQFLRSKTIEVQLVEVHPEVAFQRLKGAPLQHPKRSSAGVQERQELLAQVGLVVDPSPVVRSRVVGIDDVIDAAVVAWSARRVHQRVAVSMPDPPEVFSDGFQAAIWS